MSPSTFLLFLILAAGAVGLAYNAIAGRDLPTSVSETGRPLAPGLGDRLADIGKIVVLSGGKTLTIERADRGWVMDEKGGYPVDPAKIRELALSLASANLVEAKTDEAGRLKRLELDPPDAEAAKSKRVTLLRGDGTPLADIVIGKTRYGLYGAGRGGAYVREADQDQAWLADRTIDVPTEPLSWLDKTIIDVPKVEIATITLGEGGASPIRLVKAAGGELTLESVPEGREVDPEKVGRVAGLLASLTMQDVKPVAEVTFAADAPVARFTTVDGIPVDVALARSGEGDKTENWVRLSVGEPAAGSTAGEPAPSAPAAANSTEAANATTPPDTGAPPATVDDSATTAAAAAQTAAPTAETIAPAAKSPTEHAAELRRRVDGWAFKLPPYLAERLTWGSGDFLKPGKTS